LTGHKPREGIGGRRKKDKDDDEGKEGDDFGKIGNSVAEIGQAIEDLTLILFF